MGSYWRWPTIRLNQINWYALVYAANATVTGSPRLLRHDLRLQIARFVARARGSAGAAGNLGPGLRFNYLPHIRPGAPMNTDSAEYANITASFTREYAQARRAGMRAPSPAARRLLRQWLMRVLAGYWTHGGYVNWDTGFGFRRWHQSKKLALSQQALIGIATAPALAPRPSAPAWAKWMLDRGFEFYERELARNGDVPPGLFFGVHALPQPTESARLALARMSSNAARAIAGGLGSMRAQGAAAAVRVRPRHRAAGGDDARLQHGDRAEQPRRVPVRRDRPRAALQRAPGGRGRDRRTAAGLVRAARARHLRPARLRDPARRPRPAAADTRRRTASARGRRRGPAGRTPGRSRTCGRPASRAAAAGRADDPPLHVVLRPDDVVAAADGRRAGARAPTCCSRAGAPRPR